MKRVAKPAFVGRGLRRGWRWVCRFVAWRVCVSGDVTYGVRVMKNMKPIKATRKHRFRLDEYDPNGDPERERRIAAHRRRVQRALKRHQS